MTDRTRRTATILVQASEPRPGAARQITDALESVSGIGDVAATIGAYDAVVTVHARTPDAIAAVAARIGELDVVGRTLTLPWIDGTPDG